MQLGKLTFVPIAEQPELVAKPIRSRLEEGELKTGIFVTEIDPAIADTASFCEVYEVPLSLATNCIVVEAKRADTTWYAACLILASDMIDINSKVRKLLDARKVSFAPRDTTLQLTDMEYGGITPIGLPDTWRILMDRKIAAQEQVVVGGGVRGSKILAETASLMTLNQVEVVDIAK